MPRSGGSVYSPEFARRQSATAALEKIGVPALTALYRAHGAGDLERRRRAERIIDHIENTLAGVAHLYGECKLPMPPVEAPLVLFRPSGEPVSLGRYRISA